MEYRYIIDKEVGEDGTRIEILNMESVLTKPLTSMKHIYNMDEDEVKSWSHNKTTDDLLGMFGSTLHERDIKVFIKEVDLLKGEYTKAKLVKVLYEMEVERFLDIKERPEEFARFIAKFQDQPTQVLDVGEVKRRVSFGAVATILDSVTVTKLAEELEKIRDKEENFTDVDIIYFSDDKTKEGFDKTITIRQPIEIESGWLSKLKKTFEGDSYEKEMKSVNLTYRRSRIIISNFTVNGEPFSQYRPDHTVHLTLLGMELYKEGMKDYGWFIIVDHAPIGHAINAIMWEIHVYSIINTTTIDSYLATADFTPGSFIIYSVESAGSTIPLHHPSNNDELLARRTLKNESVGLAIILENNQEQRELKLGLYMTSKGYDKNKHIHTVPYTDFTMQSTKDSKSPEDTILSSIDYMNLSVIMPARLLTNLIHPQDVTTAIIKPTNCGDMMKPLHWGKQERINAIEVNVSVKDFKGDV